MSKAKGESPRKKLNRIAKLERRQRQLVHVRHKTPGQVAEISALEWAIPILEEHVRQESDLPMRLSYHKHEKRWIVETLFKRDGNICYLCNMPIHEDVATIDHVVPLSKGGRDDSTNYKLVHPLCNIQKGNMTLDQFKALKQEATQ